MTPSTTRIATPHGSRYLLQLCKHFAHELPTEYGPAEGWIDFPMGRVDLAADAEALVVTVTPQNPASLEPLRDVVIRHLVRFAFRETLEIA